MTPYFAMQWLDWTASPPGIDGLALGHSRFPEPREDSSVPPAVLPVDLGPLWVGDDIPKEQVARALRALVASWIAPSA